MITPNDTIFPNNIVALVTKRAKLLDTDLYVYRRPLRVTDPNQSIGVTAANWVPNDESKEMLGASIAVRPTLSRYVVSLQGFIKHMDEEAGLNTHAALSQMLRAMLYNDQPLRVGLSMLQSTINGVSEISQRWGVSQQRFFVNEIDSNWLYLSTLEFWLETETR